MSLADSLDALRKGIDEVDEAISLLKRECTCPESCGL